METMENLYVKFTVEVSDNEYSYSGHRGDAELKIQVPRSVLQHINAGDLFAGALAAALANFDTNVAKEEAKVMQDKGSEQNL